MVNLRPLLVRLSPVIVVLALAHLPGCSGSDAPAEPPADKIFYGGPIVTVDPSQPQVEALAVRDGKIVDVGSRIHVFRYSGPQTQLIDLQGNTLMPGFVEAHAHVVQSTLMHYVFADLSNFSTADNTLANAKAKLQAAHDAMPVKNFCAEVVDPNTKETSRKCIFLSAYGFDPARTRDGSGNYTFPSFDADDLDAISSETPIVVLNQSLHIAYANNRALALAGITVQDYCPNSSGVTNKPGFVCARPSAGAPYQLTGQANEEEAINTLLKPSLVDPLKLIEGVNGTFACWAKAGVTTAADMLSTTDGLLGLARSGPVRIRGYLDRTKFLNPGDAGQPRPFDGDDKLRWIGVKFVTDGSTQGFTAFLRQVYWGQVNNEKFCLLDPSCKANPAGTSNFQSADDLATSMQPYVEAGWSLALHANGDKGIDWALQAYSQVLGNKAADAGRYRMRIEHFTVNHPEQIDEVKRLNLTVSMLLGHVYYWGRALRDDIIGLDRASTIGPTGALKSRGVRFSLHSDSPVTPVNPLRLIQTAVTRELQPDPSSTTGAQVLGPDQRIVVDDAIRAVTLDAAWQLFADPIVGSLEVGKYADLVELAQNPRAQSLQDIAAIRVVRTYLGGVAQDAKLGSPSCYGQGSAGTR